MRWQAFLLTLLLISSANFAAPKAPAITLILDDVPIRQALQALAESQHSNLVIDTEIQGSVSLHLVNVPWQQALNAVLSSGRLHAQKQGNVLYIHGPQWLSEQQQQREQQRLTRPLENQIIALRNASASELAAMLNAAGDKLLSPRGSASADKRTNRLLLRDTRQSLSRLKPWIEQMDIPTGQVELAAWIVTINQQSLRELGVKWGMSGVATGAHGVRLLDSDLSVPEASARLGFNIGRLSGQTLDLELSALERKNQLEIIANPRLIASHQQPASIKQGSEIPYQVSSGQSGATSVEFKEAVLGMEVTPTILPDDNIQLKLRISQNTPGRALKQADGEILAIDKQEITTQLNVKDGETIALGGIFERHQQTGNEKLPLLGDLPLLGRLFRYDGDNQQRRELVVFITLRVLPPQ